MVELDKTSISDICEVYLRSSALLQFDKQFLYKRINQRHGVLKSLMEIYQ